MDTQGSRVCCHLWPVLRNNIRRPAAVKRATSHHTCCICSQTAPNALLHRPTHDEDEECSLHNTGHTNNVHDCAQRYMLRTAAGVGSSAPGAAPAITSTRTGQPPEQARPRAPVAAAAAATTTCSCCCRRRRRGRQRHRGTSGAVAQQHWLLPLGPTMLLLRQGCCCSRSAAAASCSTAPAWLAATLPLLHSWRCGRRSSAAVAAAAMLWQEVAGAQPQGVQLQHAAGRAAEPAEQRAGAWRREAQLTRASTRAPAATHRTQRAHTRAHVVSMWRQRTARSERALLPPHTLSQA
jgi:hypothetical protein